MPAGLLDIYIYTYIYIYIPFLLISYGTVLFLAVFVPHLKQLLAGSWDRCGSILGSLGEVFGVSLGVLGSSWGGLGESWGVLEGLGEPWVQRPAGTTPASPPEQRRRPVC